MDRAEGDRRRAVDPELCPRDRGRERHRPEDPLQPSGQARVVVDAATRAGPWRPNAGVGEGDRDRALHLQFPVHVLAAITTTRKATRRNFRAARISPGRIVHPQKWPEDLDYAGKRVVVIGIGRHRGDAGAGDGEDRRACHHAAALADLCGRRARRRTRSPTSCARNLPAKLAYHLIRWRNVLLGMYFFQLARRKPARVKQLILGGVRMALGPDYDIATHFTPRYNPWDQRLCLVPDGDLFKRDQAEPRLGRHRARSTPSPERGIRLKDGSELEADIIVTATGLVLAGARRHGGCRRRPRGRFRQNAELQGHDVFATCPISRPRSATPTRRGR